MSATYAAVYSVTLPRAAQVVDSFVGEERLDAKAAQRLASLLAPGEAHAEVAIAYQ